MQTKVQLLQLFNNEIEILTIYFSTISVLQEKVITDKYITPKIRFKMFHTTRCNRSFLEITLESDY